MTPLPSFTVTGTLFDILGDTASSELVETSAASTTITFTPNIALSQQFLWEGKLERVRPVTAVITGSGITRSGQPVKLLANDAGLNVSGIQWQVKVNTPGLPASHAYWFNAAADGATVDLGTVTPAPGVAATGIASIVATQISDSSAIGRSLLTAADQAAVQTIVGATGGGAAPLAATAVKTSAYTAAVSDLIPCDATSAAFTVTLPSAPADKSRVVVKKIDTSTNAVTVAAGGSDVFNAASGSTTLSLALQFQAVQLQYKASGGIWYVVSTDVPLAGLDTRYRANTLRRPLNNRTVVIGDSIAEWQSQGYLMQPYHADMFLNHMCTDSYQRIKNAGYFCTGGYKLSDIQTNHLPTVLAMNPAPGACIIEGGLNDIANSITFASSVATLKAIVASLLGANIWPILWTLPPMTFTSNQAKVIAWNDWLRRYAAINGFGLIDVYAELTDTPGTYFTAYDNGDTVHPSVAGHAAISRRALADGMADYFQPNAGALTSRSSADASNLFSASGLNRGLFTTNTSGVGAGFTQSGGTGTASIVAPTSGQDVRGNWQRLARTTGNTGTSTLTATISTGWSVGDVLALSFRFVSAGFEATATPFNVYATQTVSTAISTPAGNVFALIAGLVSWHTDHDGLEYAEWTVPPTASTLTLQQSIGAVVGTASPTLDVGELTLRNLTTGNLLL